MGDNPDGRFFAVLTQNHGQRIGYKFSIAVSVEPQINNRDSYALNLYRFGTTINDSDRRDYFMGCIDSFGRIGVGPCAAEITHFAHSSVFPEPCVRRPVDRHIH